VGNDRPDRRAAAEAKGSAEQENAARIARGVISRRVARSGEKPVNRADPAPVPVQIEVLMPRRLISTGSPFEKAAGYSRAVIDGDFAFVAGTTGYDYATMVIPADIASQARNCFRTIEAALKEGGFAMADIVRATYYITDLADADAFFAVCGEVFGEIRPATTLLVVAGLYKPEMKIEIEVTAKRRT
jgi:enamine deaminase RidA (YjgF/YER057c/UK114 family)